MAEDPDRRTARQALGKAPGHSFVDRTVDASRIMSGEERVVPHQELQRLHVSHFLPATAADFETIEPFAVEGGVYVPPLDRQVEDLRALR
jgi:hypothetical protein